MRNKDIKDMSENEIEVEILKLAEKIWHEINNGGVYQGMKMVIEANQSFTCEASDNSCSCDSDEITSKIEDVTSKLEKTEVNIAKIDDKVSNMSIAVNKKINDLTDNLGMVLNILRSKKD